MLYPLFKLAQGSQCTFSILGKSQGPSTSLGCHEGTMIEFSLFQEIIGTDEAKQVRRNCDELG